MTLKLIVVGNCLPPLLDEAWAPGLLSLSLTVARVRLQQHNGLRQTEVG